MAGQLDSLFKDVAKQVVADLGSSLDSSITYTKKTSGSYNTSTGAFTTTDTNYSINAPVEFISSTEDGNIETRQIMCPRIDVFAINYKIFLSYYVD